MNTMRWLVVVPLVLVALTVRPSELRACSCMEPPPPVESMARASAVFVGTVRDLDRQPDRGGVYNFEIPTTFQGKQSVFKGAEVGVRAGGSIVVRSGDPAMCGFGFKEDATYLVYAYSTNDGQLTTGNCTRTRAASDEISEELELLALNAEPATADEPMAPAEESTAPQGATPPHHPANRHGCAGCSMSTGHGGLGTMLFALMVLGLLGRRARAR